MATSNQLPTGRVANDEMAQQFTVYGCVNNILTIEEPYRNRGWELELAPEKAALLKQLFPNPGLIAPSDYETLAKVFQFEDKIAVAVAGLFNRGKTFLLNRLSGEEFEGGRNISTRGISFAVPKGGYSENLLLLDTEGRDSPLDRESIDRIIDGGNGFKPKTPDPNDPSVIDPKKRKELADLRQEEKDKWFQKIRRAAIVQKSGTQAFLQNQIFQMANILIVVVNEMTWQDQQYIEALTVELEKHAKKELIVVHNFRETSTRKEYLALRKKYVSDVYPGTVEPVSLVGKEEKVDVFVSKAESVRHVFLCKEDSDIGREINPLTYNWLLNVCIHKNVRARKNIVTFPEKLILESQNGLSSIFKEVGILSYHITEDGKLVIKSDLNKPPTYIRDVVDVDMGNIVFKCRDFVPLYDKVWNKEKYVLIFDIPGVPQEEGLRKELDIDFKWRTNPRSRTFEIKGNRTLLHRENSTSIINYDKYPHLELQRTDGPYYVKVKLPEFVNPKVVATHCQDGQLQIEFDCFEQEPEEGPDDF